LDDQVVDYEEPSACWDVPKAFVVQSKLFLNCKMNQNNTAMEAYSIELTDEFGCSTYNEIDITVHQLPELPIV